MKTTDTKTIGRTFQKIADIVTPTMGAKGRMAVLKDEFSRPYLTDDGVTVAKECLHLEGFEQMIALSMIEAASNTERTAFDGTTLTVLLTNEFYKAGREWIRWGMHPQAAAERLLGVTEALRERLNSKRIRLMDDNKGLIRDVAVITTKMPAIGDLVYKAHETAGDAMNVIIEHERKDAESSVEHVDGMMLDSGYFSESLRQLCGDDGRFVAENARIVLLAEGILTKVGTRKLFGSITDPHQPLIFVVDKGFEPESMKLLMDMLVENKLAFMFIFINDSKPEELFLDIAAKTNGTIQGAEFGSTDYDLSFAGTAEKIVIEQNRTTIIAKGNEEAIKRRVASYRKELEDNRYQIGYIRNDVITRRISNLTTGITKIKLATPTITEFKTIRMKLDDAIGAVRCACRDGVLVGAGKTLYLMANEFPSIGKALRKPAKVIVGNAGLRFPKRVYKANDNRGLDVKSGRVCDLLHTGIIDSYTSVESAIENAASIAASYLRSFILIKQD